MKIRIDKRDTVFSLLIRTRANWTCEKCGKYYPEGQRQGLHCSHLFGRRHRGTRWDIDNAFAHCLGCHQYFGSNPVWFAEWARAKLGDDKYDRLRMKAWKVTKFTRADLEMIYLDLKEMLMQIKKAA